MVLCRCPNGDRVAVIATEERRHGRLRVVQLADLVNRHDFIDVIVEHADRTRFDMRVATFGLPSNIADPGFAGRGVDAVDLGAGRGRRSYPAALGRLVEYVRRERIDVMHTHHFDPAVLGWLATRMSSTRLVVGRHYSDAILLATTGPKRRAHLFLERRTQRAAVAVIVPSRMIAQLVISAGVAARRVHIVPYAFVPQKFAACSSPDGLEERERLGLPASACVVGTFARLYRDKGHRYLLDAIGQLVGDVPDLVWLVVGDGAERSSLEKAIERTGLGPHVRLIGWRTDAMAVMSAVDVVVQPTLQEAFSSVMGEAMWLRRPLVITDVSGATDIVVDGENGLIVPKRDADALAKAIRRLVADAALRRSLGDRGHQLVTTELTAARVVPQYERIYEAVCRN